MDSWSSYLRLPESEITDTRHHLELKAAILQLGDTKVRETSVAWPQFCDETEINFGFIPKLSIPQLPHPAYIVAVRQDGSPNPQVSPPLTKIKVHCC